MKGLGSDEPPNPSKNLKTLSYPELYIIQSEMVSLPIKRKVKRKALAILEAVPRDRAFYFFTEIDAYTGVHASSLEEFCEILETVDLGSIEFHLSRGDFENWVREVLEDSQLASRIGEIRESGLSGEELRGRLLRTVKARFNQLSSIVGKL